MLKLDMETAPGGVHAQWRKKGPDSYLSLHRKDGSRIVRIHASHADEATLAAAAHALNKVFKHARATNTGTDLGDGGQV